MDKACPKSSFDYEWVIFNKRKKSFMGFSEIHVYNYLRWHFLPKLISQFLRRF